MRIEQTHFVQRGHVQEHCSASVTDCRAADQQRFEPLQSCKARKRLISHAVVHDLATRLDAFLHEEAVTHSVVGDIVLHPQVIRAVNRHAAVVGVVDCGVIDELPHRTTWMSQTIVLPWLRLLKQLAPLRCREPAPRRQRKHWW